MSVRIFGRVSRCTVLFFFPNSIGMLFFNVQFSIFNMTYIEIIPPIPEKGDKNEKLYSIPVAKSFGRGIGILRELRIILCSSKTLILYFVIHYNRLWKWRVYSKLYIRIPGCSIEMHSEKPVSIPAASEMKSNLQEYYLYAKFI